MTIIRNRAQCLSCADVVESVHRHDYRTCRCGNLSVDGGTDYLRRVYSNWDYVEEMSEHEDGA